MCGGVLAREREERKWCKRDGGGGRAVREKGRWWVLVARLGVASPSVVGKWDGGCCGGGCLVVEQKKNRGVENSVFNFF
ncbi:hypothetical protein BVRB_4g095160 [Beta vulgaris subsp. vulgaris]|uniref:Uncharacterized protein n=1 Tax=Beta vulgaris subsp. vulgaris TaxID=3555 RepID=A0A0J8BDI8_BETVV|nr:hypothetical protein BVRB_4g095160 [Beta vulgaris subsp. vulgaris]